MPILKIHAIKGDVADSLNYITNPEKTAPTLITGQGCSVAAAAWEFEETAQAYKVQHGGERTKAQKNPNVAFHLIQSFAKNEKNAELIHQLGVELAEKIGKGQYQAVIATHQDKDHIHNHIIFNAYPTDPNGKKYNRTEEEYQRMCEISDRLAESVGYSVIYEKSGESSKDRYEQEHAQNGNSWKDQLRTAINQAAQGCSSFQELQEKLEAVGIDCVYRPGTESIKFKGQHPDQTRYIRGKTLGPDFTVHGLRLKIDQDYRKGYEAAIAAENKNPEIARHNQRVKNQKIRQKVDTWAQEKLDRYAFLAENEISSLADLAEKKEKTGHDLAKVNGEIKRIAAAIERHGTETAPELLAALQEKKQQRQALRKKYGQLSNQETVLKIDGFKKAQAFDRKNQERLEKQKNRKSRDFER